MSQATDFWDPRNPIQKADRLRFYQRKRLAIGLSIDPELMHVHGCLLQGQGAGKALRVAPLKTVGLPIPESIRELLSHALGIDKDSLHLPMVCSCDLVTLQTIQLDLTLLAESVIDQLQAAAGQASDKILAVCLSDPGLNLQADDQKRILPLLDADRIAFQSGLNVVDQLPTKDLLAGGHGWPLSAMALWMIWADRSHPSANQSRLILECDRTTLATLLPPSDGLDAEYPDVQQSWLPGVGALVSPMNRRADAVDFPAELNEELLQEWLKPTCDAIPIREERFTAIQSHANRLRAVIQATTTTQQLTSTLVHYWFEQLQSMIQQGLRQSESLRLVISSVCKATDLAVRQYMSQHFPQVLVSSAHEFQCSPDSHPAIVTATMAFLHIDQMPANLPWITGTDHPRILGRLTPGSPSRYRQLLIEMADYRPPVMKLRDAV